MIVYVKNYEKNHLYNNNSNIEFDITIHSKDMSSQHSYAHNKLSECIKDVILQISLLYNGGILY